MVKQKKDRMAKAPYISPTFIIVAVKVAGVVYHQIVHRLDGKTRARSQAGTLADGGGFPTAEEAEKFLYNVGRGQYLGVLTSHEDPRWKSLGLEAPSAPSDEKPKTTKPKVIKPAPAKLADPEG
jgi:hypothetical protein